MSLQPHIHHTKKPHNLFLLETRCGASGDERDFPQNNENFTHTFILNLLQEEGPLPGPKNGVFSGGDINADKAKDSFGKGLPGIKLQCKGTQEDCSAMRLMAMFPGCLCQLSCLVLLGGMCTS